jgi:hypothetical protein
MDLRVLKLKTPDECESFAINAKAKGATELVDQARRRAVQLRAETHGATTAAETECLQAVYPYEEVLSAQRGRRQPASRTWQMIKRHGIIPAVERLHSPCGDGIDGICIRGGDTSAPRALFGRCTKTLCATHGCAMTPNDLDRIAMAVIRTGCWTSAADVAPEFLEMSF